MTAALLGVGVLLLLAGCGDSDDAADTTQTTTSPAAAGAELGPAFDSIAELPGALRTARPWPANIDRLLPRLRAIGLERLREEGQVVHIHQHRDCRGGFAGRRGTPGRVEHLLGA